MRFRPKKALHSPAHEALLAEYPLWGFSFYLSGRVDVLLAVGDEVLAGLDALSWSDALDFGALAQAELA